MFHLSDNLIHRAVSRTKSLAKEIKGLKPRGSDWSEAPPRGSDWSEAKTPPFRGSLVYLSKESAFFVAAAFAEVCGCIVQGAALSAGPRLRLGSRLLNGRRNGLRSGNGLLNRLRNRSRSRSGLLILNRLNRLLELLLNGLLISGSGLRCGCNEVGDI